MGIHTADYLQTAYVRNGSKAAVSGYWQPRDSAASILTSTTAAALVISAGARVFVCVRG
jgi:hypothetical protein